MPRNYKNTIIYKIVCKDINIKDFYVGSTTDFTKRKSRHKSTCYNTNNEYAYNYKIYKIIRDNGGWDNWEMVEVEKYPCNDGNEARARERYYYESLQPTMNTALPIKTNDDEKEYQTKYKETNKERISKQRKQFREDNKEKLKEIKKKYYEENKEVILERSKDYCKEYIKNHKDERNEYRKQWRLKNTIQCECGGKYIPDRKSHHMLTKKHIDYCATIGNHEVHFEY